MVGVPAAGLLVVPKACCRAGEREPISLSKEKVKSVLSPRLLASEEAASESQAEQEEGEGTRLHARPATRGRVRKHDSSPGPEDGMRPHKLARLEVGCLCRCPHGCHAHVHHAGLWVRWQRMSELFQVDVVHGDI